MQIVGLQFLSGLCYWETECHSDLSWKENWFVSWPCCYLCCPSNRLFPSHVDSFVVNHSKFCLAILFCDRRPGYEELELNQDRVSTITILLFGSTYIRHGLPVLSLIPSSSAMVLSTLGTHTCSLSK